MLDNVYYFNFEEKEDLIFRFLNLYLNIKNIVKL